MNPSLCCVYLLQSIGRPDQQYVGICADINGRLALHNAGRSLHTSKFRPWAVVVAIEFADSARATAFERYLKTGSGRAFAKRHFR